MELPQELVLVITAVVGAAVTWLVVEGVKDFVAFLGRVFKVDLSDKAAAISTALAVVVSGAAVAMVLGVINALLSFVPPDAVPVVDAVLKLLILLLGGMGIHRRVKKFEMNRGYF